MFKAANILLRVGLAFAFLYPPYAALMDPTSWISYFPSFMLDAAASIGISNLVLLHSFGVVEVIIALWLLSGWRVYYPAALATVMLAAIVIFDFSNFEVLFRDVSIGLAAASLALAEWARAQYTPS